MVQRRGKSRPLRETRGVAAQRLMEGRMRFRTRGIGDRGVGDLGEGTMSGRAAGQERAASAGVSRSQRRLRGVAQAEDGQFALAVEGFDLEDAAERDGRGAGRPSGVDLVGRPLAAPSGASVARGARGTGGVDLRSSSRSGRPISRNGYSSLHSRDRGGENGPGGERLGSSGHLTLRPSFRAGTGARVTLLKIARAKTCPQGGVGAPKRRMSQWAPH